MDITVLNSSHNGIFRHSVQCGEEKKRGQKQAQWLFTREAGPTPRVALLTGTSIQQY